MRIGDYKMSKKMFRFLNGVQAEGRVSGQLTPQAPLAQDLQQHFLIRTLPQSQEPTGVSFLTTTKS